MKRAFDAAGVPTPGWRILEEALTSYDAVFAALGKPVIVKPAISGGSMGVGTRNVVQDADSLAALLPGLIEGYRGWNLAAGGLIAESFIDGPEYTCFLTGDYRNPSGARIYEPVERVFHPSLPDEEKFLSFDRLWEIYEDESAMPGEENFYDYALVSNPALANDIRTLSWQAYASLQGTGYTRVDIRQDKHSGRLYVLEANAQCGISEDENFTSIGAILKFSGCSFTALVKALISDALSRPHIRTLAATQPLSRA
jgi:D-alanine-D-alanine ligase